MAKAKIRESRYPERLTVLVPRSMARRIKGVSDELGVAESVIVRRALVRGLKSAEESIRRDLLNTGHLADGDD